MITPENVRDLFDYKDGKLIKLYGRYAGPQKGSKVGNYLEVWSGKSRYKYHRVVWLWHNGEWPTELDHINRDTSDNRIENLRQVTRTENNYNRRQYHTNSSGVTGVCWSKQKEKWFARIGSKHLGSYSDFNDAVAARQQAEARL